jgi:hypothetical protein
MTSDNIKRPWDQDTVDQSQHGPCVNEESHTRASERRIVTFGREDRGTETYPLRQMRAEPLGRHFPETRGSIRFTDVEQS